MSANETFFFFQTTSILGIYIIYVISFENKHILRESTFKLAVVFSSYFLSSVKLRINQK